VRGGDHQWRAARIMCRRWGVPRTLDNIKVVADTYASQSMAFHLAIRDMGYVLQEHPLVRVAEWLVNRTGRTFK